MVHCTQNIQSIIMVTLISNIATATSRARQRNGVLRMCAKGPRDVQNTACTAEMSVTFVNCIKIAQIHAQ